MSKIAAAILTIGLLSFIANGQLSKNCLGCICEASSSCNATIGCSSHAGYHCGPFLISWNFWKDAGQPTFLPGDDPNRKGAFEDCANDVSCSADILAHYFSNFEQDCNGDGRVTCYDYALLHKLGGYSCNTPPPQNQYFDTLQTCLNHFNEN